MQDTPRSFKTPLTGMGWSAWLQAADEIVEADGHVEALGPDHAAVFYEDKPILLVTFETHRGIARLSQPAHPLGWSMVKALGWSHLCVVANGDTWFRDRHVYGYFDRLADDGFFDEFEQVIFYGAGACGYAAAAFSVAAPGAKVLMLRPQATLDPRVTEWDDRYLRMRRSAFTDRYGYAPDMLDAATRAVVIYDPEVDLDAMHSALFNRGNVLRFRTRHLGYGIEEKLCHMGVLPRLLAQLSADKLTRQSPAALWRKRREEQGYLFPLMRRLIREQRDGLTVLFCENVLARIKGGPRYRNALSRARARLDAQDG